VFEIDDFCLNSVLTNEISLSARKLSN